MNLLNINILKIQILTPLLNNVNTPVYFRHADQPGTATADAWTARILLISYIFTIFVSNNRFTIHSKPDTKNPYNHYDVGKI